MENEKIIWKELVTEKGKKYEVGYEVEPDSEQPKAPSDGKHDFGVSCDWYPTEFEQWKDTVSGFRNISGITKYSANNHNGSTYKYIINFRCEEHYDYHFFDETGDDYRCNVYRNGKHWVRYNSDKPRIVYIKGD